MLLVLVAVSKILAFTAGILLTYAGLFLYEDEEGRLQNILEEQWVKLRERRDYALAAHAAFMRQVARISDRAFDWMLGETLFSLRALGVSISFSIASFGLLLSTVVLSPSLSPGFILLALTTAVALVLGVMPALTRNRCILRIWFALVLVLTGVPWFVTTGALLATSGPTWAALIRWSVLFYLVLLASFGCDLVFIAATRRTLRWCSKTTAFYRIGIAVLANLALAIVLVILPRAWPGAGATLAALNTVNALAASVFLILAVTLLAHMLLWPILERPIYTLQRLGIAGRRKLLIALGLSLIAFGTGVSLDNLARILE